DEFGNASPISNVATGRTLAPPTITVAPSQLSAALLTDQQTTQVLTLSNAGPAELNFKIDVTSRTNPGLRAPARVLRTFPVTSGSANETPPPNYPLSTHGFDEGHSPGRGPLTPADIRITNRFAAGQRVLLLYSGGNVSEIQTLLAAFPDIATVDLFNGAFS